MDNKHKALEAETLLSHESWQKGVIALFNPLLTFSVTEICCNKIPQKYPDFKGKWTCGL